MGQPKAAPITLEPLYMMIEPGAGAGLTTGAATLGRAFVDVLTWAKLGAQMKTEMAAKMVFMLPPCHYD